MNGYKELYIRDASIPAQNFIQPRLDFRFAYRARWIEMLILI